MVGPLRTFAALRVLSLDKVFPQVLQTERAGGP